MFGCYGSLWEALKKFCQCNDSKTYHVQKDKSLKLNELSSQSNQIVPDSLSWKNFEKLKPKQTEKYFPFFKIDTKIDSIPHSAMQISDIQFQFKRSPI